MKEKQTDIVFRYIKTKSKNRKLVTYRSDTCDLRIKHEKITNFINERFIPSIFAKGYVKNCSIYYNALAHMYNDYFVMLDIKDFFPHICHKQLAEKLFYELNLIKKKQISKRECYFIVQQCSVNTRGLPLGFITSPVLSNIYMKDFDGIFYGQLKKLGLNNVIFTRYADDITVSFKSDADEKPETRDHQIIDIAAAILSRYGLQLNKRKTRSYNLHVSNHVRITGVNIVKLKDGRRHLTVGRSLKKRLFWEALDCWKNENAEKKQHVKGLQSFVLSIEKEGYEKCYSETMIGIVRSAGYATLKELIDSL